MLVLYGFEGADDVVTSLIFTALCFGALCGSAWVLRHWIIRRALGWALSGVLAFLLFMVAAVIANALGSQSHTHFGLQLVAVAAAGILHRGYVKTKRDYAARHRAAL